MSTEENVRQRLPASLFVISLLIAPAPAVAQAGGDQWRFSVTPYLWLPSLEGNLRYGPPPAGGAAPKISVNAEDILSALDFAFMLSADARKGRWSIATDFMYLDLSADESRVKSVDFNPGPGPSQRHQHHAQPRHRGQIQGLDLDARRRDIPWWTSRTRRSIS